jgi:hypothetical protein
MSNIDRAFKFYGKHIYDAEKIQLLKDNKLKVAGHVHSVIWELFGAILTGRKAEGITGADLVGWEVKSAKEEGSFEYQYHRNAHLEKLDEDCIVNHLYCSYSDEYDGLEVRVMKGNELSAKYFSAWKPLCINKYSNPANLRFRKSIGYGHVKQNGLLVLQVLKGKLVFQEDNFEEVLSNR